MSRPRRPRAPTPSDLARAARNEVANDVESVRPLSPPTSEHAPVLEVTVTWGDTRLHLSHLTPPRAFVLGARRTGEVGFELPESLIGPTAQPLVELDARSTQRVIVVPPRGARASKNSGGAFLAYRRSLGGDRLELALGERAIVELDAFRLEIALLAPHAHEARTPRSHAFVWIAAIACFVALTLGLRATYADPLDGVDFTPTSLEAPRPLELLPKAR